jgi:peptide/nickel transport system permease protein
LIAYLISRVAQSIFVLLAMSLIVFLGIYVIGDPVQVLVSPEATPEEIALIRENLGLDQPLVTQYLRFLGGAAMGNLGNSFVYNESALVVILRHFPATLELAMVAMVIAITVGIPLGMWAGLRSETLSAKTIMACSTVGASLPTFWVGLILIMTFAVFLGWLPASGRGELREVFGLRLSILTWDGLSHILLPAVNLALFKVSLVIRLARAGTREMVGQEFIRFARATGQSPARVVLGHLLKNIMIPIVTFLGLEFGSVLAFSVVTERVFSWPGMGNLLVRSLFLLDRPIVVAYLMLTVVIFVVINFIVDVIYTFLDPRIRYAGKAG